MTAAAPAHADTAGTWVYFHLAGGSSLTTAEGNVSAIVTSEGPVGFPISFVPLDIQAGFLAYVPTSLTGLMGVNVPANPNAYPSTAVSYVPGTDCAATDTAVDGTSRFAATLPGATSVYNPVTDPYSAYNESRDMNAQAFWSAGYRGKTSISAPYPGTSQLVAAGTPIDVALIDTGVSPVGSGGVTYPAPLGTVSGLDAPSAVVNGPDLSFESQSPDLTHLDGLGHGSAMAQIIHTVAPDARIVNVKVGDATGAADVTQMIAAIDWVREHRNKYGLNIRVVNIAYGVSSFNTWQTDELSKAVDRAWQDGLVVVIAGGNYGSNGVTWDEGVMSPGYDKRAMAVAAYDPGTNPTTYKDDNYTDFSMPEGASGRLPDLAAPGAHVTTMRVANAQADNAVGQELCTLTINTAAVRYPQYPYPVYTDAVGHTWLRGSGTSQATAEAAGAAALVLSKWPQMTNDALKNLLKNTAQQLPNGDRNYFGSGAINLSAAAAASPNFGWTYGFGTVSGGGSLENSRGGFHLFDESVTSPNTAGCLWPSPYYTVPPGQPLCGEKDIFGRSFVTTAHATLTNSDATWTDDGSVAGGPAHAGVWNGEAWTGAPAVNASGQTVGFVTDPNTGQLTWPSIQWYPTVNWAAGSFLWNTNWVGSRWVGSRWVGSRWVDGSWSGSRWVGSRWVGSRWVTGSWADAGWR